MVRALWCIPIALLTAALAAMPTEPPNLALALETQKQLVAEQPSNAKAHNDLGNLLVAAQQLDAAEVAYKAALALAPGDPAVHFNLAVLYQQTGRRKKAQEQYRELLALDEHNGWAHYQLGVLLEARGQRAQAVEHYAKAFAYDESLTLASNNPHLIENRLVTEALLQARLYREQPGAQVPRRYGDAARIRDLMLDLSSPAGEPATEMAADRAAADRDAADRDVADRGASGTDVSSTSEPPIDEIGAASTPRSGGRTLTHEDLRDTHVGQAKSAGAARAGGSSPGYRPASPSADGPQYRRPVPSPSPSANRSGAGRPLGGTAFGGVAVGGSSPGQGTVRSPATRPGTPIVSPQPGSGGRPSRRSTSQLELQLLPERMPGERYAQLEPAPRG